ncbi:MAG: hypothetical protein QM784_12375 [Polyangiaceae bacterium]
MQTENAQATVVNALPSRRIDRGVGRTEPTCACSEWRSASVSTIPIAVGKWRQRGKFFAAARGASSGHETTIGVGEGNRAETQMLSRGFQPTAKAD